jgi:2-polyprenyl-3-methyl-5-hydroxy-6-metoxy-1,4-benzoquinol methylase
MNDLSASPELEEVPCNLCGSLNSRVLYERPYLSAHDSKAFAATTDEFRGYGKIARCLDCGLSYTNPRPKASEILKGYGNCIDETYLLESSSRSINAHFSLNTIKPFASQGKLLEIGSSVGYFLNAARTDFEVTGLEPSTWACEEAKRRFSLQCYAESFESSPSITGKTFDVVAMSDVIEHLLDPKAALLSCGSLLKKGGILYLVTPDIGSLSAKIMRAYWWGLRPAHIYYFDRATITRMLREAGFEVLLVKSFGRIFSYAYWLSRLRHYPKAISGPISGAIKLLGLQNKLVYIDTRDSMEICAKKL